MTIGIIGIVAVLAFIAINPEKRIGMSRDIQRLADRENIEEALQGYLKDNKAWPTNLSTAAHNMPYMIQTTSNSGSSDVTCKEIVGDIPKINLDQLETGNYITFPTDPLETNADSNGIGYYIKKKSNGSVEVNSCVTYDQGHDLNNSLVSYWKLDESSLSGDGSSNDVLDSSGSSYNCYSNGGLDTNSASKINRSGSFDGNNDFTNCNQQSVFNNSNDLTVSIWFNADSLTSNLDSLFFHNLSGDAYLIRYYSGNFQVIMRHGSSEYSMEIPFTDTGNWHMISFTWDSSERILLTYLDGFLTGSSVSTSISTFPLNATYIGLAAFGSPTVWSYFDGYIDEVVMYNRVLTAKEILQLYDTQK